MARACRRGGRRSPRRLFAYLAVVVGYSVLTACGGGGDAPSRSVASSEHSRPVARTAGSASSGLDDGQRIAAATATANSTTNACSAIRPFYWEVGDALATKVSGSLKGDGSGPVYLATTAMAYSSASKWLYGAYLAQRRAGALGKNDIKMLTLRSGYHDLRFCAPWQTVDQCLAYGDNGTYDAAADGKFFYDGAHLQKHASMAGLGTKTSTTLVGVIKAQLGSDLTLQYNLAQPSGAAVGTPETYARFLRKLLSGQLILGSMLGSHAVCTNPAVCPGKAIFNPMPADEAWEYSIAHWIESDPIKGDGAFSSPGVSGFYPWIDASRTYYGIVARDVTNGVHESVHCGQLIRTAWLTGIAR